MSARGAVLRELVSRVSKYQELEALIASGFEIVDNYRVAVRRDDVVRFVCDKRSDLFENVLITNHLRRDVRQVVHRMGGVVTSRGHRAIFRRVKPISLSIVDAIEKSRHILS